jgi:hypothetical protein
MGTMRCLLASARPISRAHCSEATLSGLSTARKATALSMAPSIFSQNLWVDELGVDAGVRHEELFVRHQSRSSFRVA